MFRFYQTLAVFLLLFLCRVAALGCTCTVPSVCLQYSRADAVFVGRLKDVRDDPSSLRRLFPNKLGVFQVERVFKGEVEKEHSVTFEADYCVDRPLVPGKRYLVYLEKSYLVRQCNRTAILDENGEDFHYVSSLSRDDPIFTIRGRVEGLGVGEWNNTKIVVITKNVRHELRINKDGEFEHVVKKPGIYEIIISLPMIVEKVETTSAGLGYDVQTTQSKNRTIIRYETEFATNACDDRLIQFSRSD